ncbi:hypothetical protein [Streptomyces vietnamensis]|uniref:hypothetical protein n=1 Tax=Streptomyces vietnamensis TaxID=362257 RepID=UPI00131B643E|nr:hypothetical protein [Streptomyces vietnamensis]
METTGGLRLTDLDAEVEICPEPVEAPHKAEEAWTGFAWARAPVGSSTASPAPLIRQELEHIS